MKPWIIFILLYGILKGAREPIKKGVLVAAILRNGVLTVPKGNTTIEKDDHIMIVAKNSKIERLSDIFED